MHEDGGYTKSYRRKWSNPVFRNLRDAAVWAWMIDMAAWRDTQVRFADRLVTLKVGQLVTSERFIAAGFCCDRSTVRRILDSAEEQQMISRQQTHGGTIITICNYKEYQSFAEVDQPPKSPSQTQGQPTGTPKEERINEVNKGEESPPIAPPTNAEAAPQSQDLNAMFGEWWEQVPRKASRGQAEKAFRTAMKRADFPTLLAGIMRYAAEREGQDPQFTKLPASWLNGRCWEDEPISSNGASHGRKPSSDEQSYRLRKGLFDAVMAQDVGRGRSASGLGGEDFARPVGGDGGAHTG